jgi:hypothetical protein
MLAAEICLLPAGDCAHSQSENEDEGEVKETTGVHAEGDDRPELLTLNMKE